MPQRSSMSRYFAEALVVIAAGRLVIALRRRDVAEPVQRGREAAHIAAGLR